MGICRRAEAVGIEHGDGGFYPLLDGDLEAVADSERVSRQTFIGRA